MLIYSSEALNHWQGYAPRNANDLKKSLQLPFHELSLQGISAEHKSEQVWQIYRSGSIVSNKKWQSKEYRMIRIQSSNGLRSVNNKSTMFIKIGSKALDKMTLTGLGNSRRVSLSGLLHVSAYLYQTGAILGRARRDRLPELISMSFAPEDRQDCLNEIQNSLRRRLETSGRYTHSFYTFYLYGTLRDMGMDFNISTMKAIRSEIRDKTEVRNFMELSGAEGLLLGSWYPDLAEKMYGKEYGAQKAVIEEMMKGCSILSGETAAASIKEREQRIITEVSQYVRRYHPNIIDIFG